MAYQTWTKWFPYTYKGRIVSSSKNVNLSICLRQVGPRDELYPDPPCPTSLLLTGHSTMPGFCAAGDWIQGLGHSGHWVTSQFLHKTFKRCICLIYMNALSPCIACTKCTPDARRDQKKALIPQGLELQMLGSHHVSAGNWSQVLCESSKYSKPLSHSSSLQIPIKLVLIIHDLGLMRWLCKGTCWASLVARVLDLL